MIYNCYTNNNKAVLDMILYDSEYTIELSFVQVAYTDVRAKKTRDFIRNLWFIIFDYNLVCNLRFTNFSYNCNFD